MRLFFLTVAVALLYAAASPGGYPLDLNDIQCASAWSAPLRPSA